ncbi:MAG: hypothetical protein WAO02_00110 [Verrucomicrobiia bacterium]
MLPGWGPGYSEFLPWALAFFQRALAAAAIFALAAALILRRAFFAGFAGDFLPLTFAQRSFCAATILALPAALIFRRCFRTTGVAGLAGEPKIRPSSFSSDCIFSFSAAALRNCFEVKCNM